MRNVIRRNHSTASPSSLLFFDCESTTGTEPGETHTTVEQRLWFGHARYVRLENGERTRTDSCTFSDTVSFWRFLLDKCQRGQVLWVFAHNIGYDLTLVDFWRDFESGEWSIQPIEYWKEQRDGTRKRVKSQPGMFVDGDPPNIIRCRHIGGFQVMFIDTMNYFNVALKELGRSVGLRKLDMPHAAAPDIAWTKYCERDCEIIERAIVRLIGWVKQHDLGMFRWTAAGQAMAAWRHRFMPKEMHIDRSDNEKSVERQSYYGGRVECCYVGEYKGDVYELDANSMFPSVMHKRNYPCEIADSWERSGEWSENYAHPREFTAAECIVDSDKIPYPVRTRDGTYWCTGRFWTTLAGPELCDAWERGHVQQIGRWCTYKMRDLFTEYVEYFWSQRAAAIADGRDADDAMCKLFLNSLYGKFGQLAPRWQDCEFPIAKWMRGRHRILDWETKEWTEYRSVAGNCQRLMPPAEHKKSFAAISAWVTSHARLKIRKLAEIAGNRNVLYVVTDALYCTRDGYLNLMDAGEISASEMGKLKLRRYGSEAAFYAANDYLIGTNRVLSGVKANAVHVGAGLYRETVFESLSDIVSRPPDGSVHVSERLKAVQHKVKRVDVGNDGWTRPVNITADGIYHLNRLRQLRKLPSMAELLE